MHLTPEPIYKHEKRYLLVVQEWWREYIQYKDNPYKIKNTLNKEKKFSEEFDTYEELTETLNLYKEMYADVPRPIKQSNFYYNKETLKIEAPLYYGTNTKWEFVPERYDFDGNARWWGYMIIDFDKEKILEVKGDKLWKWGGNPKSNLRLLDHLFRKPGEIPQGYKFDENEYEGWLRFRWGDHKNALDYVEPEKKKSKKVKEVHEEASEEDLKKYLTNYTEPEEEEENIVDTIDNALYDYYDDMIKDFL